MKLERIWTGLQAGVLAIFLGVCLVGSFLGVYWAQALLRQWTLLSFLVLGFLLELLCGDLDLSVGAHMMAGATLFIWLLQHTSQAAAFAGLLVFSVGLGACKGALLTILRVPSLVVMLALQVILGGSVSALFGIQYLDRRWYPFSLDEQIAWWCASGLMLAVAAGLVWLLRCSYLGRYCTLIGENRPQLERVGMRCGSTIIAVHMLAGLIFAMGALALVLRVHSANIANSESYLYQGIMAACLGGVSLLGGRGRVLNMLFGALVMVLGQLLTSMGQHNRMTVLQGIVILAALWQAGVQHTRRQRQTE